MADRDLGAGMLREMLAMLEQADRLNRQFFHAGEGQGRRPGWGPPVDVFDTSGALLVLAALPGVPRERVQVHVDDDGVAITGERPLPAALRAASVRQLEIPYGRFERHVGLPAGRYRAEPWELVDGCLILTLRKIA